MGLRESIVDGSLNLDAQAPRPGLAVMLFINGEPAPMVGRVYSRAPGVVCIDIDDLDLAHNDPSFALMAVPLPRDAETVNVRVSLVARGPIEIDAVAFTAQSIAREYLGPEPPLTYGAMKADLIASGLPADHPGLRALDERVEKEGQNATFPPMPRETIVLSALTFQPNRRAST